MPIIIAGQVGPQAYSDGVSSAPPRMDRQGALVVSELQGRYGEYSNRGQLFVAHAIVTAPVIYTTAAATGGPLLWNGSSTVKAQLLAVGFGTTISTTVAAAIGITGNIGQAVAPTATTAIDSTSNLLMGGSPSACTTYRIGTVTTPGKFLLPFAQVHTGALTVDTTGMQWVDLGGMITVPPNCWASVAASATASTLVAQIALIWAEISV